MARASGDQEREPGSLHAGDIAGKRRPPQGVAQRRLPRATERAGTRLWSRMDEQRCAVRLQAREHRTQAGDSLDARERASRKRQADAPACERTIDVARVSAVQRDGPPHAEGVLERQRSLVVGVDQDKGLLAWKPLDPQRTREAHEGAIETVELNQGGAMGGGFTRQIDHVRTLARQVQHRQPTLTADERKLAARRKRLH